MAAGYHGVRAAAAAAGCSPATISRWMKSGRLAAHRIPRAGRPLAVIEDAALRRAVIGTKFEVNFRPVSRRNLAHYLNRLRRAGGG